LDDPHCVFARLKKFVSRYTLEIGERITGIPAAEIQQIADTMAKSRPGSGSESVMLADWTSLHLDIIACDRGLKRFSASLYEM